jgi:two-component system, LytTR family, response regulator
MFKTIIIDDEPLIRESIKQVLEVYAEIVIIGDCGSVSEGETLIKNCKPDLLFLDIQLVDGTGFDLLKRVKDVQFDLIFVTSFDNYAINAIKFGAFDYILKPIDADEFDETIRKLFNQRNIDRQSLGQRVELAGNVLNGKNRRLTLRMQDHFQLVDFDDIIYCKSDGGYTTFYLTGNRKIMVSKSIIEYERMLPIEEFLRTHQSYIVNINFVDKLTREGFIILKDKTSIPVSVRKKEEVVKRLTGA